jgi:hypothetical protein
VRASVSLPKTLMPSIWAKAMSVVRCLREEIGRETLGLDKVDRGSDQAVGDVRARKAR